jgi:hypothetical protein
VSRRLLLYVSRAGASLARWERGGLRDLRALTADAEGWGQLDDCLRSAAGMPVHVAVDSVEEHYRSEVLPRAWGRDRREMTQRRLRQILHQTPYRAALRQGPAGGGQVGDRYLFMGLTAPELLQPWLAVLRLRRVPVAGIWLLPVLSQTLLHRFQLAPRTPTPLQAGLARLMGSQADEAASGSGDRLLLVSEQTGGLRLTYFDQGRLRFSRLAPEAGGAHAEPLAGYLEQIERTRQALLSQRLLSRGDPLRVCLVDPLNTLEALRQRLHEDQGWRCEILSRQRLLAGLGLPPALLTESADALGLALLARPPADGNLLPKAQRRDHVLHRLRRGIALSGALWLTATLGLGLALLLDAWHLGRSADALQASAQQAQAQAERLLEREGGSARFEALWQTHEAWRWVMIHRADPAAPLEGIAAIAARHPDIRLSQMRWVGPTPTQPQRLWLEGEVQGHAGDYRLAHGRIEDLAADLRRSGWQTEVTRWPLDTSPQLEVQGGFGQGQEGQAARFGLTLAPDREAPAAARQGTAADSGAAKRTVHGRLSTPVHESPAGHERFPLPQPLPPRWRGAS